MDESPFAFLMRSSLLLKFSELVPKSGSAATGASSRPPVSLMWASVDSDRSSSAFAGRTNPPSSATLNSARHVERRTDMRLSPDEVGRTAGRHQKLRWRSPVDGGNLLLNASLGQPAQGVKRGEAGTLSLGLARVRRAS